MLYLGRGFEQLDRITVRVFDLDLLAARTALDLIPEMETRLSQRRDG